MAQLKKADVRDPQEPLRRHPDAGYPVLRQREPDHDALDGEQGQPFPDMSVNRRVHQLREVGRLAAEEHG